MRGKARLAPWLMAVRIVRAPLLMVAAITLLEMLARTPLGVPYEARGLFYVLLVAVAAATDGLRAALISSLFAVAFAAYAPYLAGTAPDGQRLTVQSTGMGGPSAAIVIAELAELGARRLLRTGTCGALDPAFGLGDLLVGALRERQMRLVNALEAEREQLRANARALSDFMNAAAHELRTPVTVITGYLSMLQEGSFGTAPPRWTAVLETVARRAEELSGLVEEMLLSGRVDAGTVPTARVGFDLRRAVQEAVERADPRAALLHADLTVQLPSHALPVEADPEHVARILDTLIDNALDYGGRQPWVRITATDDGDAQVLVEDHGRGIPAEMKERIFDRFVRAEDPDNTPVPGSGLGLAISRDLAEGQGGSLALVRSEVGAGSVFVFRLPVRRSQPVGARS